MSTVYAAGEPTPLVLYGRVVAEYVTKPDVPADRGPRPFLHPVRTLGGTITTDVLPEDHLHHLGVSVSMPDVSGTNLWGGRTYVKDQGYTWLDDHARIEHVAFTERSEDRIGALLRWYGHDGAVLIDETRLMQASIVDETSWVLDFAYELTNVSEDPVRLGSPVTNGRPGPNGYGGFFWRCAPGVKPRAFNETTDVEAEVNGSRDEWVVFADEGYQIKLEGLGEGDHWFVRTTEYPGVCVALAFEQPRFLAPGDRLERRHRITVSDA